MNQLPQNDDDLGVTIEWMQSLGFVKFGRDWWWIGEEGSRIGLDWWDTTDDGNVFRLPTNDFMPKEVLIKTRGEVRALCKLFKVKTKEA